MPFSNIPTSTARSLQIELPDAIAKIKAGFIDPYDNHRTVDETPDPMRDIGVEILEEVQDSETLQALDMLHRTHSATESEMLSGVFEDAAGMESYDKFKDSASKVGYHVSRFFDSNADRAYRVIKEANYVLNNMHRLTDTQPVTTRLSSRVHANQSLDYKDLRRALDNHLRLGQFINTQYKPMMRDYIDDIIKKTASHFNKHWRARVVSMSDYRREIAQISDAITDDISNKLSQYFVGPSETRVLMGGWSVQRTEGWRRNLNIVAAFLRFRTVPTFDLSNVVRFEHTAYAGDAAAGPYRRSEIEALLKGAIELANYSTAPLKEVSFTEKEYDGIMESIDAFQDRLDSDQSLLETFKQWNRKHRNKAAIRDQIASAAALPTRVLARNLETADAIVQWVVSVMGDAAPDLTAAV